MSKIYKKYRKEIQQLLNVDDLTMDVLEDECDRKKVNGLLSKYPCFFYIVLSILSRCLFFVCGVKRRMNVTDEDFVFVSCPDSIFRTKTIDLIAHGLKYQIIYLPSFHLSAALKYARYFKNEGVKALFPTFRISDILKARSTLKKMKKVVSNCEDFNEYNTFFLQMTSYLIYANLVNRHSSTISTFKGKWIMEHQKFFFIPLISFLRSNKIESVMLQHGCFFKPSYNYIPLYTNKVLTCCELEKQLFVEHGVDSSNVIVFGAPLQTLASDVNSEAPQFDLLLLMTIFNANGSLQMNILKHLKESYPNLKVLVRMRPRSRENDMKCLGESLDGFVVSEPGTPIGADLSKADRVICFSEDATFEVLNAHKSFLLVGTKQTMNEELYDKCTTEVNYKEQIEMLLEGKTYSPFTTEEELYMIGEKDIAILHDKFVSFIRSK